MSRDDINEIKGELKFLRGDICNLENDIIDKQKEMVKLIEKENALEEELDELERS